jgi:chromosome segregation ATPase
MITQFIRVVTILGMISLASDGFAQDLTSATAARQELQSLQTRIDRGNMQLENACERVESLNATIALLERPDATVAEVQIDDEAEAPIADQIKSRKMELESINATISMIEDKQSRHVEQLKQIKPIATEQINLLRLEIESLRSRVNLVNQQLEDALTARDKLSLILPLLEEELAATIKNSSNSRANSESLSNLNMRSGRIREKITILNADRTNEIDEAQWAVQLSYLERGLARGFISDADYSSQLNTRRKSLAKTTATVEEEALRRELEAIYEKMLKSGNKSPESNEVTRQLSDKTRSLKLKLNVAKSLFERLEARLADYHHRLATLEG